MRLEVLEALQFQCRRISGTAPRINEHVSEVIRRFGKVDILVNNAGGPADFFHLDGVDENYFSGSKTKHLGACVNG